MFAFFCQRYRTPIMTAGLCSLLLNLLTFAGSLYMMLVYDSVLPSRSVPTLAGLFAILVVLYVLQAVCEGIRGEALLACANGVRNDLAERVFAATIRRGFRGNADGDDGLQATRDLDHVHAFLASAGPAALFDLPWIFVFLIVLSALHWALGLTALLGAVVLGVIALASARVSQTGVRDLTRALALRNGAILGHVESAETARALGMVGRLARASLARDSACSGAQTTLARILARFGGASRLFRLLLQSAILSVGALLVIKDEASGGVILAASLLSGRALAPVDQAIAQWQGLAAARAGWARLWAVLATSDRPSRTLALAPPCGNLDVRGLWVTAPGTQTCVLADITFSLKAGQVLAVIGPSGSGKTSLARALLGLWQPTSGEVRLDGATPAQWDVDALGRCLGYVPQVIDLLDGTIGQNIARFDPEAKPGAIIAAARAAGLHELILGLPDGYDTRLTSIGTPLSAGQRQRLGLARALYGDPFLIVLDEANSNLDAQGHAALAHAVERAKARGAIVVMVTHRPAALSSATHVAVLHGGRLADFGERNDVLSRIAPVRPHAAGTPGAATGIARARVA